MTREAMQVGHQHATGATPPLLEIERAAAAGWPALERVRIGPWLARYSSGGSVRANSVSTLPGNLDNAVADAPSDADLEAHIAAVVRFYRLRGATPRFNIVEGLTAPVDLDLQLEQRGWHRHGEHVTMAKAVATSPAPAPAWVRREDGLSDPWLEVYLSGLSADRRGIATVLVGGVPAPRMFFAGAPNGAVVASGLSVLESPLASVQCMATLPAARRTGAARGVLAAIEAWAAERGAAWLYLQAEAGNHAAIGLYESVGFRVAGRYHTRELPSA